MPLFLLCKGSLLRYILE
uniref:Uncharacterized protein n=1 Tax=Anguilla anguilla TaxID=7936 RepID=A0A0E9U3K5_ANGAN